MPDDLANIRFERKADFKCNKCGFIGRGFASNYFANEEVDHYLGGCDGSLRPYSKPYDPALGQLLVTEPRMFIEVLGMEGRVDFPIPRPMGLGGGH